MYKILLLGFLTASLAMPEQQVNLEDIEDDNLKTEKQSKALVNKNHKPSPQMQYGFKPMRTEQKQQQPNQEPQQLQYTQSAQQQYYFLPQQYIVPKYYTYRANLVKPDYQPLTYITNNNLPQQQFYTPQYVLVYPDDSVANSNFALAYVHSQYIQPMQNDGQLQETSPTYQVQYVASPQLQLPHQPQPKLQYQLQPPPKKGFSPKSLLDSYVPSQLQIQYLKQQQSHENYIQHNINTKAHVQNLGKNLVYRNAPVAYRVQYVNYHSSKQ